MNEGPAEMPKDDYCPVGECDRMKAVEDELFYRETGNGNRQQATYYCQANNGNVAVTMVH